LTNIYLINILYIKKLKSWEYPKTIEANPETFIENDEEDDGKKIFFLVL